MFAEFLKVLQVNSQTAGFVVFVVSGLTWVAGQFGLKGKAQLGLAIFLGALFGSGFYLSSMGVPATAQDWLYFVLTVCMVALLPSGFYEVVKGASKKAGELVAKE